MTPRAARLAPMAAAILAAGAILTPLDAASARSLARPSTPLTTEAGTIQRSSVSSSSTRTPAARSVGATLLLDDLGAGLPSDGVASRPSRDVQAVLRAQADPPGTGRQLRPFSIVPPPAAFAIGGYALQPVPAASLPYALTAPVPLVDTVTHDANGVRMLQIGDTLFDHPVRQASYGLANLSSYDLTHDQRYLDRAIAQADRLVANKVVSRDAWYFPYAFDFELHHLPAETMHAPWYSAMSQGQALSLFVRLHQETGDAAWLTAADGAAASFGNLPADGLPWVVQVDTAGFLWFEEYPLEPEDVSDFTFNGHMFALFGLYDYAQETGDPVASQLFDGGVMTTRRYSQSRSPAGFRIPGWISGYCLSHGTLSAKYHAVVTAEMLGIHSMTADGLFAQVADRYRDDYPSTFSSSVRFHAGTWTGYHFDSKGKITGHRTTGISRTSTASSDRYARIKGRGIYYHIASGALKGYWVAERPGLVSATGRYGETSYFPARSALFPTGISTGFRFDAQGLTTSKRVLTVSKVSSAPFDATAIYGGVRYAHITAGRLADYWVAVSRLTLR